MKRTVLFLAFIVCCLCSYGQIDTVYYLTPEDQKSSLDSIRMCIVSTNGKIVVSHVDSSEANDHLGVIDTMVFGGTAHVSSESVYYVKPELQIIVKKIFSRRYLTYLAYPWGSKLPYTNSPFMVQNVPTYFHDSSKMVLHEWLLWKKTTVYIIDYSGKIFYQYITYFPFDFTPDENNNNNKYELLLKKLRQTKPKQTYQIIVKDDKGKVYEKYFNVFNINNSASQTQGVVFYFPNH